MKIQSCLEMELYILLQLLYSVFVMFYLIDISYLHLCFVFINKALTVKTLDLYLVPEVDQVIPQVYQGKNISRKAALDIIAEGKPYLRQNTPGLIYGKHQVPISAGSQNKMNWRTILGCPLSDRLWQSHSVFKIVIRKEKHSPIIGVVLVQFLPNDGVSNNIRDASTFYLDQHSNVRNIEFEYGRMVPAQKRLDIRTSCLTKYTRTRNNGNSKLPVMSEHQLGVSLFEFNQLFYQSSTLFSNSLTKSIKQLKKTGNTLDLKVAGRTHNLLPTYMCSSSLHNGVHIDANDLTSSFAIFYQEKDKIGHSYFAFPDISLLIELQSPVMIFWDGFRTRHCSIAIENGITSMFGCSKKRS